MGSEKLYSHRQFCMSPSLQMGFSPIHVQNVVKAMRHAMAHVV